MFAGVSRERWSSAWRGQVNSLAKMLAWCDWEIEENRRRKDEGDVLNSSFGVANHGPVFMGVGSSSHYIILIF